LSLVVLFLVFWPELGKLDAHTIELGIAAASVAILWLVAAGYIWFQITFGTMLLGYSPELELVRVLIDAHVATVTGSMANIRSFRRRRQISAYLSVAANLLEEQMVRMLAHGDTAAEAVVRPHLAGVAAGLRQNLAWLATPTPDTQKDFARSIANVLIAVATGDLAQLPSVEPFVRSEVRRSWLYYVLAVGRWSIVALGPALALWFAKVHSLIIDPAVLGVLTQFSALCFVVATFWIFDPTASNKLASVVSTGSALFGWGKQKT
jgi:hypothetical protein